MILADGFLDKLHRDGVLTERRSGTGQSLFRRNAEEVIYVKKFAALNQEHVTAKARTLSKDDTLQLVASIEEPIGRDVRAYD